MEGQTDEENNIWRDRQIEGKTHEGTFKMKEYLDRGKTLWSD